MTPERWGRVRQVFERAIEAPDREAFVADACGADQELRREVESLLAQHSHSDDPLLDRHAWEVAGSWMPGEINSTAMALTPGARLGPYQIESVLGAGGMGRVYLALDTRLGRKVAIKVLHENFSARFTREAQAISSLNHPNICALYDVGPNYLVMELVEGELLQSRLQKGPLALELVLRFGFQIAEALAAAHSRGIVHRDLKPANVMLAKAGVKVLDFGLAKVTQTSPAKLDQTDAMETAPGVVLGTPAYMSPEQALGRPADHRSDIFSFGCMLYEMISGKQAFRRDNRVETMRAILNDDPPPLETALGPHVAALERIVRHCLEKDPEDRFQSARDLAFNLDSIGKISSITERPAPTLPAGKKLRLAKVGLVAAGLVAASYFAGSRIHRLPQPVFHRLTFRRGWVPNARFAPDGKTIVYSAFWDGDLSRVFTVRPESPESYDRGLSQTVLLSVSRAGELAVLRNPRGMWPLQGTLARVPFSGGAPRDVIDKVEGADWSPSGQDLAIVRRTDQGAQLEYPPGRALFQTQGWIASPRFSPSGDRIVFIEHPISNDDGGYIGVVTIAGDYKRLAGPWNAVWGDSWMPKTGEIWFTAAKSGNRLDLIAVTLAGRQRAIASQAASLQLLDISEEGHVLLTTNDWRTRLFSFDPALNKTRELSWLDWSGVTDISRDGKLVVFFETAEGAGTFSTAYLRQTDGSPAVKLGNADWPMLSPDSAYVAAVQANLARGEILIIPVGAGPVRHLTSPGFTFTRVSWTPKQNALLLIGNKLGHRLGLYSMNLSGGEPQPITREGIKTSRPVISPDGNRVTVINDKDQILLYPVSGGQPELCRGIEPGERPVQWSQDGGSLYVSHPNVVPAKVFRVNLRTWHRMLWKEIRPEDLAGVGEIAPALTPDGKYFAYSTWQLLSELQQVDELR